MYLALILLTYNGEKEGYLEAAEKTPTIFFIKKKKITIFIILY